jgi:hypothetical protein
MQTRPANTGRGDWERAFAPDLSLARRLQILRRWFYPVDQMSDPRPGISLCRDDGPMAFLAGQIVKRLGKSGWPAKIHTLYRSPEKQRELFNSDRNVTGAAAWQSPHQFLEAADIVHKSLYWDAPPAFWEALASTVRVVEEEYGVSLEHGHYWSWVDSAHVELTDWRDVRSDMVNELGYCRTPTPDELKSRFDYVLPKLS